jgi:antitoxin ParD1/3/4
VIAFATKGHTMQAQKISISLPPEMVAFIEHYKEATGCQSRSQVISEALTLLQSRELEQAYREVSLEVDEAWEIAVGDGLSDLSD